MALIDVTRQCDLSSGTSARLMCLDVQLRLGLESSSGELARLVCRAAARRSPVQPDASIDMLVSMFC